MNWKTVPQFWTCSSKTSVSTAAAGVDPSDDTCPWVDRTQLLFVDCSASNWRLVRLVSVVVVQSQLWRWLAGSTQKLYNQCTWLRRIESTYSRWWRLTAEPIVQHTSLPGYELYAVHRCTGEAGGPKRLWENLLVRKFSSKKYKSWGYKSPILGNLVAKLTFWAPIVLWEVCNCLSEKCNFLTPLLFLTHDVSGHILCYIKEQQDKLFHVGMEITPVIIIILSSCA